VSYQVRKGDTKLAEEEKQSGEEKISKRGKDGYEERS